MDIKQTPIRFSGYTLTPDKKARAFLPGHAAFNQTGTGQAGKIELEVLKPGANTIEKMPVLYDGKRWVATSNLPLGSLYRFMVDGKPTYDCLELTQKTVNGQTETFNRISPFEADSPQKSPPMADIFQKSVFSRSQFDRRASQNGGLPPRHDHFTNPVANEEGLEELNPELERLGIGANLLKPFIGGDNLSDHKYWTVDPFALNDSFSSKKVYKRYLGQMLRGGMKLYNDGAFVNQGLAGIQFQSLLAHGTNSPYWDWFTWDDGPKPPGPVTFPRQSHENSKLSLGLLPTEPDPDRLGHERIAYHRFDIDFINDPDSPDYNPEKPIYALPIPKQNAPDGTPYPQPKRFSDSIQGVPIPVSEQEVRAIRDGMYSTANDTPGSQAKAMTDGWKRFRLTDPAHDDSGVKWDGQVDVLKMNMENPDVVDYLSTAATYWERFSLNTNTQTVAEALFKARRRHGDLPPEALIDRITQASGKAAKSSQVLPPVNQPDAENLSTEQIAQSMKPQPDTGAGNLGASLAATLLDEYPLQALPLPSETVAANPFKAVLSLPSLSRDLRRESITSQWVSRLFSPLTMLPVLGSAFAKLQDWLQPKNFETALAGTLDQLSKQLPSDVREKLRYPQVRSLVTEQLAERIYMFALTGLDPEKATPEALMEGYIKTVPSHLRKTDPETAAVGLPRFLKQRLKQLDLADLGRMLESSLKSLDPKLVSLADAIVKQREFGLNWRVDAMKDMGDMDQVRSLDPEDRPAEAERQLKKALDRTDQIFGPSRKLFPKASVIVEATDFHLLANQDGELADKMMRMVFESGTVTGTPNMNFLYSPIFQLLNMAQRPDEFGQTQMTPSAFLQNAILPMTQTVPNHAQRGYQQMPASHDFMTASHALLVNPFIFTYDKWRSFGLRDDLREACAELKTKPCFADARAQLGILSPGVLADALDRLQQQAYAIRKDMPFEVRSWVDEEAKVNGGHYNEKPWGKEPILTPAEVRPRYIDALFEAVSPKALGLTKNQHAALKEALKNRITEPSEAKAMRAVLVNNLLDFNWQGLGRQLGLAQDASNRFGDGLKNSLWQAIDRTIEQAGPDFGHRSLDTVLQEVFANLDQVDAHWKKELPSGTEPAAIQDSLKKALYEQASVPVLDKLLRMYAVLNALPGIPSVYLQDLFAQFGSEWSKNQFVQNRNAIRVDKLDGNKHAEFRQYLDEVGNIFRTREQFPVLHNGTVIPVPADDENGILPIVRDNGQQQVITLINTGKPTNMTPHWQDRIGNAGERYTEIRPDSPAMDNYVPNLQSPYLNAGSVYRDTATNRYYQLQADGQLIAADLQPDGQSVKAREPREGLNFRTHCMLVREDALYDAASSFPSQPPAGQEAHHPAGQ